MSAEVTAKFMKKFTALYDACSDDENDEEKKEEEEESKEPCLKKAKVTENNDEFTVDEAVEITCGACDYYMTRMIEYMPEMTEGVTNFGRNAYAIAKELKAEHGALLDATLVVTAIKKAEKESSPCICNLLWIINRIK